MKIKLFTLTALSSAVLSFSLLALAQSAANPNNSSLRSIPRPKVTNLSCQSENKEFGQYIYLTNTTGQTLKKGTNVRYMVGLNQSQFNLANDLGANATVKQASLNYEGHPACKAWMYQ
jgi:hypothetical protein